MKISKVYLIKPLGISDYGHSPSQGEKPQLAIYIAYTEEKAKEIEERLKTTYKYRNIKIEEVRLDSLRYVPLLLRKLI
jgi:hypothetical protein